MSNAADLAKFANDGLSGAVLQVVSDTELTGISTTSTSFADNAGLSVNITPSSTSNKILVLVQFGIATNDTWNGGSGYYTLFRDSTNLGDSSTGAISSYQNVSGSHSSGGSINYLDSPATTSQITYTMQMRTNNASYAIGTGTQGQGNGINSITVMEIAE